jgi:hypothetical protein
VPATQRTEIVVTSRTAVAAATFPARRLVLLTAVAGGAGLALAIASRFAHAPDWALLARQPWVVQLHIAAALTALLLGTVQLVGIKGTGLHRLIGWTWVVAMVTVAVSSLFIPPDQSGLLLPDTSAERLDPDRPAHGAVRHPPGPGRPSRQRHDVDLRRRPGRRRGLHLPAGRLMWQLFFG